MAKIKIEIIYLAENMPPFHCQQTVDGGSTVENILRDSPFKQHFPELDWYNTLTTGIFGKTVPWHYQPEDGDRIELYRPLTIDPMTKRRLLAEKRQ